MSVFVHVCVCVVVGGFLETTKAGNDSPPLSSTHTSTNTHPAAVCASWEVKGEKWIMRTVKQIATVAHH